MRKKGFTLIELLVVIAIIAMLLAILMPALNKVKRLAQRLVCATNLKGLGTAMIVYANDFEDEYPVQGGGYDHTWSPATGGWWDLNKDWSSTGKITVGASMFLLVREADVSTKSFVCKSSDQKAYDGAIPASDDTGQELVELWDFGHKNANSGPRNCVSYSYQFPYSLGNSTPFKFFPPDSVGPAGMALMADKNPWFDPKLNLGSGRPKPGEWEGEVNNIGPYYDDNTLDKGERLVGNAFAHNREGQNVLFNDGHSEFVKISDCGYENDNIYTNWDANVGVIPTGGDDDYLRIGPEPAPHKINSGGPKSNRDTWLVNDDDRTL